MALTYEMVAKAALGKDRDTLTITKEHLKKIEEVKEFLRRNKVSPLWPDEDIYNVLKEVTPPFSVMAAGSRILDGMTVHV